FAASDSGWAIGAIPLSLTVGDLNGDLVPEGIWANTVPDSLTILTTDGQGTFSPYLTESTSTLPRHTVIADVNGDGITDMVVATSGDFVDVFLGQGGGGFNRVPYPVPSGVTPYGVFAADLDADGDVDLATANFNGHDVSVLLNDGTGVFGVSTEYPAGAGADSPRFVDGSDLDDDGDIDLAVCNGYSYDVSILINDGAAGFTAQPLIPVGESPNFLEIRDYDGDSIADIVTINSLTQDLSFLKGNGDATFQPVVNYDIGGSFPFGLTSVDMDGDGDLDAVVPVRGLDGWRIMWNDGQGAFSQGTLHLGGLHCHSIGAADWDGDGDVDVLAGYAVSQDAYYYEQIPSPTMLWTAPNRATTGVPVADPVQCYFNTDLDPVSVVASAFRVSGAQSGPHGCSVSWDGGTQSVTLTMQEPFVPGEIVTVTASGGVNGVQSLDGVPYAGYSFEFMTEGAASTVAFSAQSVALPGSDPVALAAADLDGDNASDLIVANYLSADVTLLLTGNGGVPAVAGSLPVGVGPLDVWPADLDGDGVTDLAVANVVSGTVTVLLNNGDATFTTATPVTTVGAPFAVGGGDFDRDGDVDLAVAEVGPDQVTVFWNDGAGAFPASVSLAMTGAPLDLAVADFDNDGDLDLVAVDSGASRMEIFLSDAAGGFQSGGSFGTGSVPVSTFPWDTDGDGWIDLISSDYAGAGVSVLQNLGDGTSFAPAVSLPAGAQPHGLWGGDLTGDGNLELLTANSGESTVTIFGNQGGGIYDPGTTLAAGMTPYAVVGGDWNGDGRIDVASVNRTSGDLTFLLNGVALDAPPVTSSGLGTGLLGVAPNPSLRDVDLRFSLARAGEVSLEVFDLRGRRVATVHRGLLPAGEHRATWDGRDARGLRVGAGVYFLRMDAEDRSSTRKLLRLR
ncbi:MAG: T9SS type A sorting domain-containing protein, partial [Gemmatimonadetes bacterium]|nr:T9SS type A sorting domain-containing protein [Gemmatimonadota bacterium]